jgi:hypothetical protein
MILPLALALGIGSTTTIFSIVRAVFLRGLPYADPESLVQLRSSVPEQQRRDPPREAGGSTRGPGRGANSERIS